VSVGALGCWRVFRRREIVLDGACELREDGSAVFDRLDLG